MRLALRHLAESGASGLTLTAARTRGFLVIDGLAIQAWPDRRYIITETGREALAEGRYEPR